MNAGSQMSTSGVDDVERTDRWLATHAKILESARSAFSAAGYARANTIEIAAAAGVTERTLFRHFSTKQALFHEAVVSHFHDYVEDYVARWRRQPPGSLEPHEAVRQFYSELFELFDEDRGLVIALMSARAFEGATDAVATGLADQLKGLENVMRAEASARDYALDPAVLARIMFGLAMTATVHGEWLFGPAGQPTREHLLDQLTAFTNHGLRGL